MPGARMQKEELKETYTVGAIGPSGGDVLTGPLHIRVEHKGIALKKKECGVKTNKRHENKVNIKRSRRD